MNPQGLQHCPRHSPRFLLFPLLALLFALLAGCAGTPGNRSGQPTEATTSVQPLPGQARATRDRHVAVDTSRTVDLTRPAADAWDRIRRGFAVPNMDTELTRQWTDYYAAHPEAVQRMASRAGKYLYYIVDEINRRGLPTELALLPFVESAYNPGAYSRAQAAGLWQFIPSTGTHFKLTQDWWRDQRRDPIASTNAALDYLEYLFEMQGDWYLALASYNWGEGSVRRAMDKNAAISMPTDYLSLTMPDETRNYVPKLQAIKNIVANPQKYAVVLPPVENIPYFATVKKTRDIDIEVAARLAEMPLEEFQALNPSFNRPIILGRHEATLLLPRDKLEVFNTNLSNYKGSLSSWKVYDAKRGESVAAIAKRHGITESRLRDVNDIPRRTRTVSRNQTLLVPGKASGDVQLASLQGGPSSAVPTPPAARGPRATPNVRTHTVRSGDTLFALARRYGTSVDALRALNNLKGNTLKVGSRLRVPGTGVRG
ncbi:Membrane-bound lytic murein transglycosylase D precursor [plant metagenome]|uniref:Membrane-bound lytic murein transglycosylase D n=1 Tax=plant metagenome TaxID=1297885 RepID=A0A484U4D9_9ZZZZ